MSKAKKKDVAELFGMLATAQENAELAKDQNYYPFITTGKRIIPTSIATSALFSPIKTKALLDEMVIASLGNTVITFSGRQLDESQADVWMQLIYESRNHPSGSTIDLNRAGFLKAIGKTKCGLNYLWLHQALKDLVKATIIIETRNRDGTIKLKIGSTETFRMVEKIVYDDKLEVYNFKIDKQWQEVLDSQFSLIDWQKRLEIKGAMAKALQRFISASSSAIQRNSLARLMLMFNYNCPVRKFKVAILSAVDELIRVGVIEAGNIEVSTRGEEQLVVILTKKPEKTAEIG